MEGGAGFGAGSPTPTCLLAMLRAESRATPSINQTGVHVNLLGEVAGGAGRPEDISADVAAGKQHSQTLLTRASRPPTGVDSVVQWLALRFWSQGLNPCFTDLRV